MIDPGGIPTTIICDRVNHMWSAHGPAFRCETGIMILMGSHALDSPAMVETLRRDGWVERSGRWYCSPACADIGERARTTWLSQRDLG
jgi:hypothetical protein